MKRSKLTKTITTGEEKLQYLYIITSGKKTRYKKKTIKSLETNKYHREVCRSRNNFLVILMAFEHYALMVCESLRVVHIPFHYYYYLYVL